MSAPAFPTKPGAPAFGTQVAGDVVPFPPQNSAQRQSLKNELLQGKQKYESSLPAPTLKITPDQLKSRIFGDNDND